MIITKHLLSCQSSFWIRIEHSFDKVFGIIRHPWPRISFEINDRSDNCLSNTLFRFCIATLEHKNVKEN